MAMNKKDLFRNLQSFNEGQFDDLIIQLDLADEYIDSHWPALRS